MDVETTAPPVETTAPPGETTAPPGDGGYLVIGLAVGIPCGLIIVILVFLIGIMLCITMRNSRQEEVEAMYMRRRFQGLSLEEQRRRQRTARGRNVFRARRRSSATTESKPSTTRLTPNSRVIRENPFGLQDWQLKLSGIDVAKGDDSDPDSPPRSPLGIINPILLQPTIEDKEEVSYEPVRPPERKLTKPAGPIKTNQPSSPRQPVPDDNTDSDSDSFNPYD